MVKVPELLAPVGDWITLGAALDAGADAVYVGVRGFNMRAGARNFSSRDLPKIAARCHARKARAYLALNTLVYQGELGKLRRLLQAARKAGIDAVIAADLAVFEEAERIGIEIHGSTQLSVANAAALKTMARLGASRLVLARECSLRDIRRIRNSTTSGRAPSARRIGIEVFAHGAMCVSVSGRCLLSEHACGSSANRGACTQPCRREYRLITDEGEESWRVGEGYLLSPKDLCTMPFLETLIEAGVDSLKIEGRMRSPEYVFTTVSAYRRALDFYASHKGRKGWRSAFTELKKSLMGELESVYNRGFSSGFYHGKPIGEWATGNGNQASKRKQLVGKVLNYYKKPCVAELSVCGTGFTLGETLLIEGPTSGFFQQSAESLQQDGRRLDAAAPGTSLTLPMSRPVRAGDKVYVLRQAACSPEA